MSGSPPARRRTPPVRHLRGRADRPISGHRWRSPGSTALHRKRGAPQRAPQSSKARFAAPRHSDPLSADNRARASSESSLRRQRLASACSRAHCETDADSTELPRPPGKASPVTRTPYRVGSLAPAAMSPCSYLRGTRPRRRAPVLGSEKSELGGRNCGNVVVRSVSPELFSLSAHVFGQRGREAVGLGPPQQSSLALLRPDGLRWLPRGHSEASALAVA
jgi:hypothetical protein